MAHKSNARIGDVWNAMYSCQLHVRSLHDLIGRPVSVEQILKLLFFISIQTLPHTAAHEWAVLRARFVQLLPIVGETRVAIREHHAKTLAPLVQKLPLLILRAEMVNLPQRLICNYPKRLETAVAFWPVPPLFF